MTILSAITSISRPNKISKSVVSSIRGSSLSMSSNSVADLGYGIGSHFNGSMNSGTVMTYSSDFRTTGVDRSFLGNKKHLFYLVSIGAGIIADSSPSFYRVVYGLTSYDDWFFVSVDRYDFFASTKDNLYTVKTHNEMVDYFMGNQQLLFKSSPNPIKIKV
ncbi:hypothetical protein ACTFIU_001852 [Dictyostelium citrinum]